MHTDINLWLPNPSLYCHCWLVGRQEGRILSQTDLLWQVLDILVGSRGDLEMQKGETQSTSCIFSKVFKY